MNGVGDIAEGDHVEWVNGPAGNVRHITRYSQYRVMFTLDSDRCVDADPTTDVVTVLGPCRYRIAHVGDD